MAARILEVVVEEEQVARRLRVDTDRLRLCPNRRNRCIDRRSKDHLVAAVGPIELGKDLQIVFPDHRSVDEDAEHIEVCVDGPGLKGGRAGPLLEGDDLDVDPLGIKKAFGFRDVKRAKPGPRRRPDAELREDRGLFAAAADDAGGAERRHKGEERERAPAHWAPPQTAGTPVHSPASVIVRFVAR